MSTDKNKIKQPQAVAVWVSVSDLFWEQHIRDELKKSSSMYFEASRERIELRLNATSHFQHPVILISDAESIRGYERDTQVSPEAFGQVHLILIHRNSEPIKRTTLRFADIQNLPYMGSITVLVDELLKSVKYTARQLYRLQLDQLARLSLENLTLREQEMLELMVQGYSIADMGKALGIATPTVKIHKAKVLDKTACANLRELILRFAPLYLMDDRLIK